MSDKDRFLDMIVRGGVKETKRKLKKGLIRRDEPIDLEKELRDAKKEIGDNMEVRNLGITDDDLRDVIKKVSAQHKLQVKLGDGTVITPEPGEKMSVMDRATSFVLSKATPSPRGVLYDSIKSIMKAQAQKDIQSGTVVVPVDVRGYATKVLNNSKHIPGLRLKLEDYMDIIREICEEFSLEMKEDEHDA